MPGQGVFEAQIALGRAVQLVAVAIDDQRLHAGQRQRRRARLQRRRAGQRADQDAAGLGLPPGVDDRAAVIADHAVVPQPGLGVDRLADAAEQAQAGPRRLLHRPLALAHQAADGGRRGVEDVDLVLVHHLPEPAGVGVGRHALEHQRGGAVRQRAIDDVGVAGDPADIGGAPVDLAGLVVEHQLMREAGPDHVAAGGVQHALRLAGAAGGVEDEQRVLGVHLGGRAVRRGGRAQVVVGCVARRRAIGTAPPVTFTTSTCSMLGHCRHGGVGVGLQRHLAAAAAALVGGDQHLRAGILDAAGQAVGREAAEHHGVDRADAGAGEHGHRRLHHHRQIDADPVALLHAERLQHVGEPADPLVQVAVGDVLLHGSGRRSPR